MHVCICGVCVITVLLFALLLFIFNWKRRFQIKTSNKAVLITGCDTGFGYHTALQLCNRGFRIYAGCLNSNGDGAKKLASYSKNIHVITLDVTKDKDVEGSLQCVENSLGDKDLWAVINNAGISLGTPECEWCPLDRYQRVMDVNFIGVIRVTKAFLPLVRKSRGRIVNVASIAGRIGPYGFSSYAATKFALIGFSECLRKEMEKFNVKVVTIEPWMYKTNITDVRNTMSQNKTSWENSPAKVRNEYGEDYFKAYQQYIHDSHLADASDDISPVVDVLEDAVCCRHPMIAYTPQLFHYLRTWFLLSLPYNVQEYLLLLGPRKVTDSFKPKFIEVCTKKD